ncbi:hypothetical protein XFF7767_850007 [Xanthomonas citri pv. fuscans]|nr:hypothetical protein XFF7767_850007 [Xanthomonas citri pv. fuscans]
MARAHLGSTSSLKETPRDQITGAAISIDESVGPTDRLSLPLYYCIEKKSLIFHAHK